MRSRSFAFALVLQLALLGASALLRWARARGATSATGEPPQAGPPEPEKTAALQRHGESAPSRARASERIQHEIRMGPVYTDMMSQTFRTMSAGTIGMGRGLNGH